MEDSDSREGFGWLGRSDDYAGSRNQGPMDVRNMIDGVASTGADVTRDAWLAAPQTDQSREQSQHALIVQAALALTEFQQLQWECEANNCGLLPPIFTLLGFSCPEYSDLFSLLILPS